MKKIIVILVVFLGAGSLYGQDFWRENYTLHRTVDADAGIRPVRFVGVEGGLNFGSDGVSDQFLTGLWRGGYMDSTYVENAASQLLPNNRIGLQTTVGITYGFELKDSARSIVLFSVLKRNNISGKFSDDAFRLGFQGNTQYKGLEADISGTRFTALSWTQIRIGYATQETKNSTVQVAFSGIIGNSYTEGNVNYGKLFTDSQGLFVNGSVAADYYSSDTANRAPLAINGFGTSVDIAWKYLHQRGKAQESFSIEFLDFGFINWNKKTIHRFADTTFHYEGVDISQIFTNQNYVLDIPSDSDFIKSDTGVSSRSTFLPAVIRGSYQLQLLENKLAIRGLIAVPFWSYALPYASITGSYNFMRVKTSVCSGVAYGGYARFQVPLKLEFWLIKNTTIAIGIPNTLAFFNSEKSSGNGAFIKLNYCIR